MELKDEGKEQTIWPRGNMTKAQVRHCGDRWRKAGRRVELYYRLSGAVIWERFWHSYRLGRLLNIRIRSLHLFETVECR